jgi:hypothetical protein
MSTIEEQIIRARERGDVTIDEIMRAVVESQDMALAWYRKEENSYGTLNNQYLVIGELISAALADALREGAEAMREAAAAMPDASASRLMQAKRVPMVDQHCAGILRDHADKIRALPLPAGSQS